MKYFIIFAGPNGSGKSTVVNEFSSSLMERYGVEDFYYINADYYAKNHPTVKTMPNGPEKDLAAWNGVNRWRTQALEEGDNIQWETVFSHPSRLEVLKDAKELGYYVILIYVATIDPDINVRRVKQRVREKGHDVPEDKIRKRYGRSVALLPQMLEVADEAFVYDNSVDGRAPVLTFAKLDDEFVMVRRDEVSQELFEWMEKYILEPLGCGTR